MCNYRKVSDDADPPVNLGGLTDVRVATQCVPFGIKKREFSLGRIYMTLAVGKSRKNKDDEISRRFRLTDARWLINIKNNGRRGLISIQTYQVTRA